MVRLEPPPTVWLASFVAVVDHGTFTAAARALNRAQPRISSHLASLERHLGAPLVERGHRRVALTPAGAAFLPHARTVLRELRSGADAVGAVSDALSGRIRIGSYPGAMAVIMAPLVRRYAAMYPGVAIELVEAEPSILEDDVAAQDIDIAIRTADVPQRHHNVPSTLLFNEHILLVVRHDHRLARLQQTETERLRPETVIVSGDPQSGWSDYRDRLDRAGVEPASVLTVAQPTTQVALVAEGFGVGLLGALAAGITLRPGETVAVGLPMPLWQREIRLYRHATARPSPPLEAFLDLLRREAPALTIDRATWPQH